MGEPGSSYTDSYITFAEGFSRGHVSVTSLMQCTLCRQRRTMESKKALGLRSQNTMILRYVDCAGKFEKCRCKYSNQKAPGPHQWTDPQTHLCKVLSAVSPELTWVRCLVRPCPPTHYYWTVHFLFYDLKKGKVHYQESTKNPHSFCNSAPKRLYCSLVIQCTLQ